MLSSSVALRKTAVLLLALLAGMLTPAISAEPSTGTPVLEDLRDGDVRLTRVGQSNVGIHLLVQRADTTVSGTGNNNAVRQELTLPALFLSIRMPW